MEKELNVIKQALERGTGKGIFTMDEVILINRAYENIKDNFSALNMTKADSVVDTRGDEVESPKKTKK